MAVKNTNDKLLRIFISAIAAIILLLLFSSTFLNIKYFTQLVVQIRNLEFVVSTAMAESHRPKSHEGDLRRKNSDLKYNIVYVRYPRHGDSTVVELPDAENPYSIEAGADLMLLHPDGTEEVLVDCRAKSRQDVVDAQTGCSVQDPVISFDGKWVYYSKYVDMGYIPESQRRTAWRTLPAHCLLFKMQLNVPPGQRKEIQLTVVGDGFATDKLAGNGHADQIADFGIRDLGPAPLPDGRLLFTSNREAIIAFRQGVKQRINTVSGSSASQIFIMDDHDGSSPNKNLHLVGHSNLHQVQHPIMLKDGRVLYTNWDDAGLREEYATATLYVDHPEGGHLEQFLEPHHTNKRVEHFATETGAGDVVVASYYPRMATWGFGTLLRVPVEILGADYVSGLTKTGDDEFRYYSRKGTEELTVHTTGAHRAPKDLSGRYTTPSAAPNDGLLVSYSRGPVSFKPPCKKCKEFPRVDAGIYYIENSSTSSIRDPASQLIQLKDDSDYNEMWPRAVVPYKAIYGVETPSLNPPADQYAPTPRARGVVPGSPIGITGTSSMQNRESVPLGRDRFNFHHAKGGRRDTAWVIQGSDAGVVNNRDIWGVRILVMTPDRYHAPWKTTDIEKRHGLLRDRRIKRHVKGYYTHTAENWKILGEFPVRNHGGQPDPDGEQDTSWLAKVPANTPHLIQALDRYGMTLSTEQTWRHVRAGETFASCGGCHAHSKGGVAFTNKLADRQAYKAWDLVNKTPMIEIDPSGNSRVVNRAKTGVWGVEFRRDILPILKKKCATCHTSEHNEAPSSGARLAMFDSTLSGFTSEARTYYALARDKKEKYTHNTENPSGIPAGKAKYHVPQMSRYIRALQARASYLVWKIYGRRLDGRTNDELPRGWGKSYEDLDYEKGSCTAPSVLTNHEKGLISRWVDLGAPIDLDRPRIRYTDDSLVPVVTVLVKTTNNDEIQLVIGLLDNESGIDFERSRINVSTNNHKVIEKSLGNLRPDPRTHVLLYKLNLRKSQITKKSPLRVQLQVYDNSGNQQKIDRVIQRVES